MWTLSCVLVTVSDDSLLAMAVVSDRVVVCCVLSSVLVLRRVWLNVVLCLLRSRVIPLGDVLRLLILNAVPLCYVTMLRSAGF